MSLSDSSIYQEVLPNKYLEIHHQHQRCRQHQQLSLCPHFPSLSTLVVIVVTLNALLQEGHILASLSIFEVVHTHTKGELRYTKILSHHITAPTIHTKVIFIIGLPFLT